jgi:hypothetical protein
MNAKGCVYIVQSGKDGMVKIGYISCGISKCALFNQIEADSGRRITQSVISPETERPTEILAALHRESAPYRTCGDWFNVDFNKAAEALDLLLKNCPCLPASQHEDEKEIAAKRTLESLGYTYRGGELWKPPLRGPIDFDLVDKQKQEITELKAKLYDLMAGGGGELNAGQHKPQFQGCEPGEALAGELYNARLERRGEQRS